MAVRDALSLALGILKTESTGGSFEILAFSLAAAGFQCLIFVAELLLLYLSPQECNYMFLFSSVSQKRASEDTTSSSPPKKASAGPKRDARQIYNPPSGKYSSNLGSFSYGKLGGMEKLC